MERETGHARSCIGYCPQADALLDLLTVREHLELFGRLKGLCGEDLEDAVVELQEVLGLMKFEARCSGALSGGNKRKLSAGMALIGTPPFVLLDEPSCGLDPTARHKMWQVIRSVVTGVVGTTSRGSSVMLTTHLMEEAEALSTRLGILAQGLLVTIGSSQQIKGRFGSSYELVCTAASVTAEDVRRFLGDSGHDADSTFDASTVQLWIQRVPAKARAYMRPRCQVRGQLERTGVVSAAVFAEWWLSTDRGEALEKFLKQSFEDSASPMSRQTDSRWRPSDATVTLLEHFGTTWRFRLPNTGMPLSRMFEMLESACGRTAEDAQSAPLGANMPLGDLLFASYTLTQATLEQVFNSFAEAATAG